jgi:hypothetical protein
VKLYHVWLLMNKVLNTIPVFEHRIIIWSLCTASEAIHNLAEHLACDHCCLMWLLDPEYVRIHIQFQLLERHHQLLLNLFFCQGIIWNLQVTDCKERLLLWSSLAESELWNWSKTLVSGLAVYWGLWFILILWSQSSVRLKLLPVRRFVSDLRVFSVFEVGWNFRSWGFRTCHFRRFGLNKWCLRITSTVSGFVGFVHVN